MAPNCILHEKKVLFDLGLIFFLGRRRVRYVRERLRKICLSEIAQLVDFEHLLPRVHEASRLRGRGRGEG